MRAMILNWNQIEWETEKAYLIKIPRSTYKVWVPKVHIQTTRHGKQLRLLLKEDMEYTVFNKIKKIKCDMDSILDMFGYEIETDFEDFDQTELIDNE